MSVDSSAIPRLIELGRWAPSGDNTQPWRFEIVGVDHFLIHGSDTRDHCVYDLDGHPSQLALGALIETLHIAATEQSLRLDVRREPGTPDWAPLFHVRLEADSRVARHPLLSAIPRRSVHRGAYGTSPLGYAAEATLQAALPPGYTLQFHASLRHRWRLARLLFANAKLRLTMREAYEVHAAIIDWGQQYSSDRVPDQALGVDALTLKIMRWAMASWERVSFMNRYMAGTLAPRLQMDLVPAVRCSAHVAIVADRAPESFDDYVMAGRAVQRFWLQATALGLQHQPELTPLIFSRYARDGIAASASGVAMSRMARLSALSSDVLGPSIRSMVWLGRVGRATAQASRSLRHPVDALCRPSGGFPPDAT